MMKGEYTEKVCKHCSQPIIRVTTGPNWHRETHWSHLYGGRQCQPPVAEPIDEEPTQKEQPAGPAFPDPPAATHAPDMASQVELSYPQIYLGEPMPVHVVTRRYPIGFTP